MSPAGMVKIEALSRDARLRETLFEGRKFFAPRLARALARETPIATGGIAKGGKQRLYVYSGGTYQPGEDHLGRRIAEVLSDEWRRIHESQVLAYLRATSPPLPERASDSTPVDYRQRWREACEVLKRTTRKLEADNAYHQPERVEKGDVCTEAIVALDYLDDHAAELNWREGAHFGEPAFPQYYARGAYRKVRK